MDAGAVMPLVQRFSGSPAQAPESQKKRAPVAFFLTQPVALQ